MRRRILILTPVSLLQKMVPCKTCISSVQSLAEMRASHRLCLFFSLTSHLPVFLHVHLLMHLTADDDSLSGIFHLLILMQLGA